MPVNTYIDCREAIRIPVMLLKKADAEKLFKLIDLRHPSVVLAEISAKEALEEASLLNKSSSLEEL